MTLNLSQPLDQSDDIFLQRDAEGDEKPTVVPQGIETWEQWWVRLINNYATFQVQNTVQP